MSRTLDSKLTVINETDRRGQAIVDLIKTYIPGFAGNYYGFRSLGTHDLAFPAVFVEPDSMTAKMLTTAKYHLTWSFSIFFYFYDNSPEDIVTLVDLGAENLIKLFSNNALGDLGGANTSQFKQYPGFWLNSDMKGIEISRSILHAIPNRAKLMRAGHMRFEIEDVVVK